MEALGLIETKGLVAAAVAARLRREIARDAVESGTLSHRMAQSCVPHGAADIAAPDVCWGLRFRENGPAHAGRGWPCKEDRRPSQVNGRLERVIARPPSGLHPMGRVRGKPEDDLRERTHAEANGP